MNVSPLFISIKTALTATAVTFLLGIAAAYRVMKMKHGKAVLDTIFTLPMILPPTVVGFFLLLLFGKDGLFGTILQKIHVSVVFSWGGAVIASAVVAFPLIYRTARSAFEQLDRNLIDAGRTLGMSEWQIFWKIIFPNCLSGIAGGTILAFSRALGEFGATVMLAGNIPNRTQTMAVALYAAIQNGERELAYRWAAVMAAISFLAIFLLNAVNKKQSSSAGRS